MKWYDVIEFDKLQQEQRHTTTINNQKILVLWHQEKVYAITSQCPHFKLPLTKGQLTDTNSIICPFHKSEFDLKNGDIRCWSPWPAGVGKVLGKISKPKKLTIYPTRIEGNSVQVEI